MSSNIWKQITSMLIDIEILFQQPLPTEYVSLSWSDIPDLLVPFMMSLIEGCCYKNYNINISVYFYDIYDMFFSFQKKYFNFYLKVFWIAIFIFKFVFLFRCTKIFSWIMLWPFGFIVLRGVCFILILNACFVGIVAEMRRAR